MNHFRRTRSGLKNQHLFYGVDIVLFVEGGNKSLNKTDILSGNYTDDTEDIIYWKNVFSIFKQSLKVKYKSVGSKITIINIAMDMIDGDLSTIFVAMDSEFDEIFNQRLIHPNILYTYGYSYENDVWNSIVIKAIIEELTAVTIDNAVIDAAYHKFLKAAKLAVYADAYMFKKGGSFFPRKSGYLFCVNCVSNDVPTIKREEILNKLVDKSISQASAYKFGSKHSIYTQKYCFGHFLADFSCQIVKGYMKKYHDLNAPKKNILYRMGINKFFQLCFGQGPVYMHHRSQLAVIGT